MMLKTPEALLTEIRSLIASRALGLRASIEGRLFMLDQTAESDLAREHSRNVWILRALVGTLDKIAILFERESIEGGFEVLGIARNLFENLVWLRLFNRDARYGLVFYAQLLEQQKQNIQRIIAKTRGEVVLFEECDMLSRLAFDETVGEAARAKANGEALLGAKAAYDERIATIDLKVRRGFALYGAAATFNSYAYQAHLLRTKVLPKHEEDLAQIDSHIARLGPELGNLLGEALLKIASANWNWRARAAEVGMEDDYVFLYSFTSKLLHATPLNIVTDKTLSASETLTMLDYAYVAVGDLLDEVERFHFEGEADFVLIRMNDA